MTNEELIKRNNAICAFMGGAEYLFKKHYPDKNIEHLSVSDMHFHDDWNFLIPVWSKLRMRLLPTAVISAIVYIDEDKISELFMLLSNNALVWCKEQNIQV